MPANDAVTFAEYEDMLPLPEWARTENELEGTHDPLAVPSRGGVPVRPAELRVEESGAGDRKTVAVP